jgi:hypothetical protein
MLLAGALIAALIWLPGCVPTASQCSKTVPAGSSASAAFSGAQAGDTVCLSEGTYSWGDYSIPAGVTLAATAGTKATVVGEARIGQAGVHITNLTLRAPASERHAVVYVTGPDFTASNLLVDANFAPFTQGFLVGGPRANILDTVIRNVRGEAACGQPRGHQFIHAIYWFNSAGGRVERVWMYNLGGFGLHFYSGAGGSAANTTVRQTVTDDTLCGFGNVFDSIQGPASFDDTIITDAGPWSCRSSGATVANSRSQRGFSSACGGSGNVTADTVYQNEAARDYRVPGDPDHQFMPGPQ